MFASALRWWLTACRRGSLAGARVRRLRPRSTSRSATSSTSSSRRTSPRRSSGSGLAATARRGDADRSSRECLGRCPKHAEELAQQRLTLCTHPTVHGLQLFGDGVEFAKRPRGIEVVVDALEEAALVVTRAIRIHGAVSLHGGDVASETGPRSVHLRVVIAPGRAVVV